MSWSARKWVFIAGAAALLSNQAVSAAPVNSSFAPVDPLVAVSLFSTPQSQAAVMGSPAIVDGWVKRRVPSNRWGQPGELGGAAIFLASAASDYVNGQIIYVDGGMLAVL